MARAAETVAGNWPKIPRHPTIQDSCPGETKHLQFTDQFPIIDMELKTSSTVRAT
jgi:hypothetical protein